MKSKVGCIVLLCLLAAPVRGQTSASFDCETNAACAALYEQAVQQSKAGQLVEAEKSYKLAYEVSHDARLLFNIARVLDKRGQEQEAMTYYRRFIEAPLQDEEQKAKARTYLEQLEAKLAARTVTPPSPSATAATTTNPALTPSGEQSAKPVYKKGWFWGVMVGSAVAVGLGIGLGVGLSNRGPTVPSGTNTIEPTF
jgi:tetratricopeptide (TPR) repeat protein